MSEVNFWLSYGLEGGKYTLCGRFMWPEPVPLKKGSWKCPRCGNEIRQVRGDDGTFAYIAKEKGWLGKIGDSLNSFNDSDICFKPVYKDL